MIGQLSTLAFIAVTSWIFVGRTDTYNDDDC